MSLFLFLVLIDSASSNWLFCVRNRIGATLLGGDCDVTITKLFP